MTCSLLAFIVQNNISELVNLIFKSLSPKTYLICTIGTGNDELKTPEERCCMHF